MSEVKNYIGQKENHHTRRAYAAAVRHFEVEWRGLLPATSQAMVDYIKHYSSMYAYNTLLLRCCALGHWHTEQGFPNPVDTAIVKQTLQEICDLRAAPPKRAKPLQMDQLRILIKELEEISSEALLQNNAGIWLRGLRDQALLLIGFWLGLKIEELVQLSIDQIKLESGIGMRIFLPKVINEVEGIGKYCRIHEKKELCPVNAYRNWINAAGLVGGPVFRRIDRWGNIGDKQLNSISLIAILRRVLTKVNIVDVEAYSTVSLRSGFSYWSSSYGWRDTDNAPL